MRACLVEGEEEPHLPASVFLQAGTWDEILEGKGGEERGNEWERTQRE